MSTRQTNPQSPTASETRNFGLLLLLASPIAGMVWTGLIYLIHDEWRFAIFYYFLTIGGTIALLCVSFPKALRPFHRFWLWGTKCLETAITYLLLSLFYYLVLTPVALCLRLFGHRPFAKKGDGETDSYWEPVNEEPKPEHYYRQY